MNIDEYKISGLVLPKGGRVNVEWNHDIWGAFKSAKEYFIGKQKTVLKKGMLKRYCPGLHNKYPNKDLTLKIYSDVVPKKRILDGILDVIIEGSVIQNIAFSLGIAPRIYEVVRTRIGDEDYYAKLTDFVDKPHPTKEDSIRLYDELLDKLKGYFIESRRLESYQANFVGDQFIDFDSFRIKNKKAFLKKIKDEYIKVAYWGSKSKAYQDIPLVGVEGCRSHERFEKLGMMDMDLTGKTVLDLGCSGGQSLFWAAERNAKRIVGVDTKEIARVTYLMATAKEYFNIETVGCDLTQDNIQEVIKKETGLGQFDVVIMFSIHQHVKFHQYMKDLCKGTMYLETNAGQMPEVERVEYPKKLRELGYKEFEYKGQVDESGGRSLYICK